MNPFVNSQWRKLTEVLGVIPIEFKIIAIQMAKDAVRAGEQAMVEFRTNEDALTRIKR